MEKFEDFILDFSQSLTFFGKQIEETILSKWIPEAKIKEYSDTKYYAWPLQGITIVTKIC